MFDRHMRKVIDPPLTWAAGWLAKTPLSANHLTILGMMLGLAAAWRIYALDFGVAAALIAASRLADGLDGPLARARGAASDFGGYLDIVCDFVFYAAVPLAFALAIQDYAVPAACLLASFLLTGVSHLAFAIHAEKRGLSTDAQGQKSFYFAEGLAEGTETIAVFLAMCFLPRLFPLLAYTYAALCVLSALGRTVMARDMFR